MLSPSPHRFRCPRFVPGLVLAFLSLATHAATVTWNGGAGGLWTDPMKWQPQQVPGANDTAVIGGEQETIIEVVGQQSVGTLLIQNTNAVLRVDSSTSTQALLTVANGLENQGTIELRTGLVGSLVRLRVSNGTLTNAVGGVIREVPTAAGTRELFANLDNRGTIEVEDELSLDGMVANSGTVNLPEGKTLRIQSATVWTHRRGAIVGTGSLMLAGGSQMILEDDFTPGGFTLDAPRVTIDGPGRLMGPTTGEFVIQNWTINAPTIVSGDMRITDDARINGPLLVTPGKTLRVDSSTITRAFLTVANGFENQGTIELRTGQVGSLVGLRVSNGTLTNAVGGVIKEAPTTAGFRQLFANLDNRGTIEVEDELSLDGMVANSGTVNLPEGKTLRIQSATVWTHRRGAIVGTGSLMLAGGSQMILEDDFTPGGFTLDAPRVTIDGPGRLMGPTTGEFVIQNWTINAPTIVSGDMRITDDARINGPLLVTPGKTLRVDSSTITRAFLTVANGFENQGTIELRTGQVGSLVGLRVSNGTLTNAVGGVIKEAPTTAGFRQLFANLDNRGTIEVEDELSLNGTMTNAPSGVLGGNGTLNLQNATATHQGAVAPGGPSGVLTIAGSFPFGPASLFEPEIGGFTVGTQHDQLVLANPATLDGAIRPVLVDGFFPKKDDAFAVLTYPSRTGTFATLDNPTPDRIAWEVVYGPTHAQLLVLNTAPTLAGMSNAVVHELTPFEVRASATDQDLPAQTFTYSLAEAPQGMAIDPTTGRITWTPTEAQGPGTHDVTVRVTDNGTPALGHTTRFAVVVNEVNVPPQPVLPGAPTVAEQTSLAFIVAGSDTDLPANPLTYALVSGPEGATFDPSTREFRWTPTEAQGPGSFSATFRVTDSSPDAVNEKQLSGEGVVLITVAEVNRAPLLASVNAQTVAEESPLAVAMAATDPDLPANGLTYSLDRAPVGMTIAPTTGAIAWTPTEVQGPGTHEVVVRVTDNGTPELDHTVAFGVTVGEVNRAPVLTAVPSSTVHAGAEFSVLLSATDTDLPANTFSYGLVGGPAGAVVEANGRLAWVPPLSATGTVAEFTVRVSDGGEPLLSGDGTFRVTVVGPVEILSATREGDGLNLRWRAVAGNTYRLVRGSTLPTEDWTPIPGEVTADGDTASRSFSLDSGTPGAYVRVELVR